jgi:hypothetical protein
MTFSIFNVMCQLFAEKVNKFLNLHFRTNQESEKSETSNQKMVRNQQPETCQKPLLQIHKIYHGKHTFFRIALPSLGVMGH